MPDRYTALRAFWQMPLGKALLTAEAQLLSEALEDVFGWEFLQVGAWGEDRELLALVINPTWDTTITSDPNATMAALAGTPAHCGKLISCGVPGVACGARLFDTRSKMPALARSL